MDFAEGVLNAAGGCAELRRAVFHYLDRFEALRLADVNAAWRDAASHPLAWLPTFASYQHARSSRSATVGLANAPPTPASSALASAPGAASTAASATATRVNATAAAAAAYAAPLVAAEIGSGAFTATATQQIARAAFGPSPLANGGAVLERLWDLQQPEVYFLVTECFRRPPRGMLPVLELCDRIGALAAAASSSTLNLAAAMTAAQSNLLLALQSLCHPPTARRADARFVALFPAAQILLRCASVVRASAVEWRVSPTLANALVTPQYVARGATTTVVAHRNLTPVVVLISELVRWHDAAPAREHAPWFAALASWAAVTPAAWPDLPFHAAFLLPHVVCLKALALDGGIATPSQAALAAEASSLATPRGADPPSGSAAADVLSTASAAGDQAAADADDNGDALVVRAMLRRNIDAAACVRTVVRSAADIASQLVARAQSLKQLGPNDAEGEAASSRNVTLAFSALALIEQLARDIALPPAAAAAIDLPSLVEREVQHAFALIHREQLAINMLFDARGRLLGDV
jgi:hypothetical protein